MPLTSQVSETSYTYDAPTFEEFKKQKPFLRPLSQLQTNRKGINSRFSVIGHVAEERESGLDHIGYTDTMINTASCCHDLKAAYKIQSLLRTLEGRVEVLKERIETDEVKWGGKTERADLNQEIDNLEEQINELRQAEEAFPLVSRTVALGANAVFHGCCVSNRKHS